MRLQSITIERFKRLGSVSFDVSDVNILIGGNNSGKSTVIQAVHFAFTLFQSLTIANKWPAKNKQSVTVSPDELIYIPSEDPYSLGYGGQLLTDDSRRIALQFYFDDGRVVRVAIRKGRNKNILVEPDEIQLAKTLSSLKAPFSIFSPGLAGVSRTETAVSDGVLLRALARGDANIVLRNILYRLKNKEEWAEFSDDLNQIFPNVSIEVKYDAEVDQFINVSINDRKTLIPLDLAGTGLLQAIQILAYLHLFSPKFIILDEPDSHLHPNNQRLLCSLLTTISMERGVQVLITTHSRHILDAMYSEAKILWVQNGEVRPAGAEDQVDLLLELGALDIKERVTNKQYKVVFLTEDRITGNLSILVRNSGFPDSHTALLPYNGVTSVHLLKPLVRQIKEISDAAVFVHRDRDYLTDAEVEEWSHEIRKIGANPFVTTEIDVEGYFCTDEYLGMILERIGDFDLAEIKSKIAANEAPATISSYVNGRVDFERKQGTIGKLDIGKLSADAAQRITVDPFSYMKGKVKLSKLKNVMRQDYGAKFEVDRSSSLPKDDALAKAASKYIPASLAGQTT